MEPRNCLCVLDSVLGVCECCVYCACVLDSVLCALGVCECCVVCCARVGCVGRMRVLYVCCACVLDSVLGVCECYGCVRVGYEVNSNRVTE
jgi:hypothetical protein